MTHSKIKSSKFQELLSRSKWAIPFIILQLGLSVKSIGITEKEVKSTCETLFQEPDPKLRFEKLFHYFTDLYDFGQSKMENTVSVPFGHRFEKEALSYKDTFFLARAWQSLSYLYCYENDYKKSLLYAEKALKVFEQKQFWEGMMEIRYHKTYLSMNNSDETKIIPECREIISICKAKNLRQTYVRVNSWLSGYFYRIGKIDSSVKILQEINQMKDLPFKRKVFVLVDLGGNAIENKAYKEGENYLLDAARVCVQNNYKDVLATIYSNLGVMYIREKKYDKAESILLKALPIYQQNKISRGLVSIYTSLRDVNEYQKDFENAYKYANLRNQYSDSLNLANNQTEYRELDARFKSALKDKTILTQKQQILSETQRSERLIYGFLFGLTMLGLSVLVYILNQKRKAWQLKQAISESELKALRSQMNPHFMFNSLNSIQQMVYNNENTEAFRFLSIYSKLSRQLLENSEKNWISVDDEIRFLELYLKMESLRFDNAFSWNIQLDEGFMPNSEYIPSMILQPIIENAIKHGLLPKQGEKKLQIKFAKPDKQDFIKITIADNGVGRNQETAPEKEYKSMSLAITQERLKLLNQKNDNNLVFNDLVDNNSLPAGTEVEIFIHRNKA